MDIPRVTDDALAQGTRAAIFALLLDEGGRAQTTAQLAETLDLHPNGVRVHLERLLDSGLVVRERERHGRGRPRDVWRVNPDARPGGDPPTSYRDLARWLAAAVGGGRAGTERAVEAGVAIGRSTELPGDGGDVADRLHRLLTAMGFQPDLRGDPDSPTYVLHNCPFRDVVEGNAGVICGLHRGMTEGILDQVAPDAELARFVVENPHRAGCEITVSGLPVAAPRTEPSHVDK